MTAIEVLGLVAGSLVVLPVIAYMVMKFGTAGFLRAKRRDGMKRTTEK